MALCKLILYNSSQQVNPEAIAIPKRRRKRVVNASISGAANHFDGSVYAGPFSFGADCLC